ncbi:MAG: HAD-IIB family hydrolase [Candidatus Gracilibacteria bacterium]|nr:HAD-IIB family hydrolase [Candidatus Gracilibacteria bacterium]
MFKMIVFDMDGTLTPSKGKMDSEMVELFKKLLGKYKVGIISGGKYELFQTQVLPHLGNDEKLLSNLYVCPTCSTVMYLYQNGEWNMKYSLDLTLEERTHIINTLNQAIIKLDLKPEKTWGEQVEDRRTQISFSALGQDAPLEFKSVYDPDFSKRNKIREYILDDLKGFNVLLGGASTIDITRDGVDKAYGVRKLSEISGIDLDEMIFVGDAVFPGGNDYPPLEIGVTSKRVFEIEDTKKYIKMLID